MCPGETTGDLAQALGDAVRALRIDRNLNQRDLAAQAGVSLNAVRHLESGGNATLASLIQILRALGREDWLKTLAPVASINPLTLPRTATPRQRVRRPARP
jgi:transcriptional regulator with XRE-family HTH domain